MPYIDCFYVCEDIAHRGPLNIKKFDTLDTAVEVYKALPSGTVKALGVQNTAPLPGSLDFVQCHNGRDVLIQDYKHCTGWDNPEISRMIHELRNHLILQEERSIRFITPEYDDLFTLPDGAKLLLQYPDGSPKLSPARHIRMAIILHWGTAAYCTSVSLQNFAAKTASLTLQHILFRKMW